MKKIFYLLFSILLISFTACEEDEDLPEPTQTGANMMAAKINGKPWQKKACWGCIGGGNSLVAEYDNGVLWITGQQNDEQFHYTVRLIAKNVSDVGIYNLKERASGNYGELNDYSESGNSKSYETTASSPGKVTITKLDTQDRIISGTFSFRAQREPEGENGVAETVEVTEGWFDVKY